MRTSISILIGALLSGQAGADILYTNITEGATFDVVQNVTILTGAGSTDAGVALGGGGAGTGILTGTGNLSFETMNSNTNYDTLELAGINGNTTLSNYTGSITAANDLSATTLTGTADIYTKSEVAGIWGNTTGNIAGNITATAKAGNASTTEGWAYAHAFAKGVLGNVTGNIDGNIHAEAIGGTSSSTAGSAGAHTESYGIEGNLTGDINGVITAIAASGNATAPSNTAFAYARASGVQGDVTGNVAGTITATATAGTATGMGPNNDAVAAGIDGSDVHIDLFSGNIAATATAGTNVGTSTDPSMATAYGIRATNTLFLAATNGSIHASILAPSGFTLDNLPSGSRAYALRGGLGNDNVSLNNMDLIGDIDLGSGSNLIDISGSTRMAGNILATGGVNNILIHDGMFTPVGTVQVSDMGENSLTFASTGGLDLELYENPESELNSRLVTDGQIFVTDGASIAAHPKDGQNAANMIGNNYDIVDASNISGAIFVENEQTILDLDIIQTSNNVSATVTGPRAQEGKSTPSGNSVAKGTVTAAKNVMNDLSSHARQMRDMLRLQDSPNGPAGPYAARTLCCGESLVYVRQFNDIGTQDSTGSRAGFDWQTSGFMVGIEKTACDCLILGMASGGAWTDLDGKDGAGGGASKMFISTLYANWFSDTWYSEGGLFYGHSWNDTQRIATDQQRYMGDYDSDLYGMWIEAGRTFVENGYEMEPYARATYISGNHDGYTDRGGSDPLSVDSHATDNLLTELGVRGSRSWIMENNDILSLELKAGWQHELLDASISANGSLLGVQQELTSPSSDRNALVLGVKFDWQIRDELNISIEYAPTVSENWRNHAFNAGIGYKF